MWHHYKSASGSFDKIITDQLDGLLSWHHSKSVVPFHMCVRKGIGQRTVDAVAVTCRKSTPHTVSFKWYDINIIYHPLIVHISL